MPRITPPPAAEFRSLLLPPIRIPLRTLQSLNRSPCRPSISCTASPPQCFAQRRSLNLYITAKSKTVLGMHKVIPFNLYDIAEPSASEHRVNLVKSEVDPTVIATDLSLQDLYENHIRPGNMLYLASDVNKRTAQQFEKLKEQNVPGEAKDYAILEAESTSASLKKTQLGELKRIHFNLASPIAYAKLSLDRAYQFINGGSPVEFHIRIKGSYIGKEKHLPGPDDVWPWMHDHFPHLRPDFILKAMPENSFYLIKPVCDGKQVEFVIARPANMMPQMDLTERLMKVKSAVQQAIKGGAHIQLPAGVRERVIDTLDKESDGLEGANTGGYAGRQVKLYGGGTNRSKRAEGQQDDENYVKRRNAKNASRSVGMHGSGKIEYSRGAWKNKDKYKSKGDKEAKTAPPWLRRSDAENPTQ